MPAQGSAADETLLGRNLPSHIKRSRTSHAQQFKHWADQHDIVIYQPDDTRAPSFSLLTGGKWHVPRPLLRAFFGHVDNLRNMPLFLSQNHGPDAFRVFFDIDMMRTEQSDATCFRLVKLAIRAVTDCLTREAASDRARRKTLCRCVTAIPSCRTVKKGEPKLSMHIVFPELRVLPDVMEGIRLRYDYLVLHDPVLGSRRVAGDLEIDKASALRVPFSHKAERCSCAPKNKSQFNNPPGAGGRGGRRPRCCGDCVATKQQLSGPDSVFGVLPSDFPHIKWERRWFRIGGAFDGNGAFNEARGQELCHDVTQFLCDMSLQAVPPAGFENDPEVLKELAAPSPEITWESVKKAASMMLKLSTDTRVFRRNKSDAPNGHRVAEQVAQTRAEIERLTRKKAKRISESDAPGLSEREREGRKAKLQKTVAELEACETKLAQFLLRGETSSASSPSSSSSMTTGQMEQQRQSDACVRSIQSQVSALMGLDAELSGGAFASQSSSKFVELDLFSMEVDAIRNFLRTELGSAYANVGIAHVLATPVTRPAAQMVGTNGRKQGPTKAHKNRVYLVYPSGPGSRACANLPPGMEHHGKGIYFVIDSEGIRQKCTCRCPSRPGDGRLNGPCSQFSTPKVPFGDNLTSVLYGFAGPESDVRWVGASGSSSMGLPSANAEAQHANPMNGRFGFNTTTVDPEEGSAAATAGKGGSAQRSHPADDDDQPPRYVNVHVIDNEIPPAKRLWAKRRRDRLRALYAAHDGARPPPHVLRAEDYPIDAEYPCPSESEDEHDDEVEGGRPGEGGSNDAPQQQPDSEDNIDNNEEEEDDDEEDDDDVMMVDIPNANAAASVKASQKRQRSAPTPWADTMVNLFGR